MKNLKNNTIGITILVVGFIIGTLGLTYAIMVEYGRLGRENSQLVLGDIYMHYKENNQLLLEDAMPSTTYDESKYFEFTISGKNTYTKEDIWYEIVLEHGDEHETRTTRIRDDLLKFTLVEVNGDEETKVVVNQSYENINNTRIWVDTINKNTTNKIDKTYRLYMWISYDTIIGIGDTDYDYDIHTWNSDVFASIKVKVNGDFTIKKVENSEDFKKYVMSKQTDTCKTYVDEDGITYISGSNECIDFNYVWYSGKLWRITAIYPDGTMKMITDGMITAIAYGSDYNFYTDEENTSYMYQWLNEDFLDTLYDYENIIVTDYKWNATRGNGTISYKLPTTEAEGATLVNAPVGLLNSYEYYKSYQNTNYGSGYLNIGYDWCLLNRYSTSFSDVWYVNNDGSGDRNSPSMIESVRPVINLKSTIRLEGGSGTASDPYMIKGDKEEVVENTTLINTRTSGEYANFNEELYRIVGIENETTKLIKADYVKDGTTNLTKKFASSSTFGKDTNTQKDDYWDYYLNNTWKKAIEDDYEEMLVEGTYFIKLFSGGNYKGTVCTTVSNTTTIKECEKTTSTWNGFVGLPRYGEMFASQTRDRTYNNAQDMWLITPYDSSHVWIINIGGNYQLAPNNNTYGARPTIHLKDTVVIKSGKGTKEKPFVVGLPN